MKNNVIKKSIIWICVFALAFSFFAVLFVPAQAETDYSAIYTDVMEDLALDSDFNSEDYKYDSTQTMFDVISIAESDAGELFLYLFQGCATEKLYYPAIEARISQSLDEDDPVPKDYKLTLLSRYNGFAKYKVEGLKVKSDIVRRYQIIQIAREYSEIDWFNSNAPTYDSTQTIRTRVCAVKQNWTVYTLSDGTVEYGYTYLDVVEITDRFDGFIRYSDGFFLHAEKCTDGHFIAFNTDWNMDKVIDADVSFYTQTHNYIDKVGTANDKSYFSDDLTYNKVVLKNQETPTVESVGSTSGGGLFAKKYTWKRIQSVSEFLNSEKDYLSEETKTALQNKKWVFRFKETQYTSVDQYTYATDTSVIPTVWYSTTVRSVRVTEVSIMRIHFELDGESYNLGVVCNKVSSDMIPDGEHTTADGVNETLKEFFANFSKGLKDFFSILIIIIVVVLVAIFCPWVFTLLWLGIKFVFKALWWIIAFPFNLIGKAVKKKNRYKKNE